MKVYMSKIKRWILRIILKGKSGKLTLEYFYSFLKKIKDNKLDVLKEFLNRKIVFEKQQFE